MVMLRVVAQLRESMHALANALCHVAAHTAAVRSALPIASYQEQRQPVWRNLLDASIQMKCAVLPCKPRSTAHQLRRLSISERSAGSRSQISIPQHTLALPLQQHTRFRRADVARCFTVKCGRCQPARGPGSGPAMPVSPAGPACTPVSDIPRSSAAWHGVLLQPAICCELVLAW
jgi:hypothetical protein